MLLSFCRHAALSESSLLHVLYNEPPSISTYLSLGLFICLSPMVFSFLFFSDVKEPLMFEFAEPKTFLTLESPMRRFEAWADGDREGGCYKNACTLMPMHEICSHFFLQNNFPQFVRDSLALLCCNLVQYIINRCN